MTAAAETTMRDAKTIKTELDHARQTLATLGREQGEAHRRGQQAEAERKRLEAERVNVEAQALLSGNESATEDLERRIRELRLIQSEAQDLYQHKTQVMASVQRKATALEHEWMPYERELLITAHKELRSQVAAAYRELGQLHMRAQQIEQRMQFIDRTIDQRADPHRYQGTASLQFRPGLANSDAAASFYENGDKRAPWEV